jgi:hypothetical protein
MKWINIKKGEFLKKISVTQNNDDNDESSIAYQPEELSNENIGSFPMLFS